MRDRLTTVHEEGNVVARKYALQDLMVILKFSHQDSDFPESPADANMPQNLARCQRGFCFWIDTNGHL